MCERYVIAGRSACSAYRLCNDISQCLGAFGAAGQVAPTMEKDSKIYLAGHTGLLGSAMAELLAREGFSNVITQTRDLLDLTDKDSVLAHDCRGFCHMDRTNGDSGNIRNIIPMGCLCWMCEIALAIA